MSRRPAGAAGLREPDVTGLPRSRTRRPGTLLQSQGPPAPSTSAWAKPLAPPGSPATPGRAPSDPGPVLPADDTRPRVIAHLVEFHAVRPVDEPVACFQVFCNLLGNDKIPMTNEKWIGRCPTAQLADCPALTDPGMLCARARRSAGPFLRPGRQLVRSQGCTPGVKWRARAVHSAPPREPSRPVR